MTVVIAVNTLLDITLIADSRVSYEDKTFEVNKGVFKLIAYPIPRTSHAAVFAYAGYLDPLSEVFEYLFSEKLSNYDRDFTMISFSEDVERWLLEIYPRMSPQNSKWLRQSEILLCGFDVYKRDQTRGQQSLQWIQNAFPPAAFMYRYKFGASGKVHKEAQGLFCVIGSGNTEIKVIEAFVADALFNRTRASNSTWAEPLILAHQISGFFKTKNLPTVGEPFQYIHLTSNEVQVDILRSSSDEFSLFPLKQWIDIRRGRGSLG